MRQRPVYQFKITLKEMPLSIWRRIQVSDLYSFWDLHVAIQDAMGWSDYHLHEFQIRNPKLRQEERIGLPDPDGEDYYHTLPGWEVKIRDYFNDDNKWATYRYDFGDGWIHQIIFEGMETKGQNKKYPLCMGGENHCPPEDVGGTMGYSNFLKIIKNPKHSEYDDMMAWIGGKFDPHVFNAQNVKFDSPNKRLKIALGDG
jgi:hypothetical protein